MASNNSTGITQLTADIVHSRESDDNLLLAMSSIAKMEAARAACQDADRFQQSKTATADDVTNCLNIQQQRVGRIKDDDSPELEEQDSTESDRNVKPEQEDFDDGDCGRMTEAAVNVDDIYRISVFENLVGDDNSNQAEEESATAEEEPKTVVDDSEKSASSAETEVEDTIEPVEHNLALKEAPPTPSRLRVLLPILTANIIVKGVQVPRFPRGGLGNTNTGNGDNKPLKSVSSPPANFVPDRSSRLKFQFPDGDLHPLLEEDENAHCKAGLPRSPNQHRRGSTTNTITGFVPLRRKSFTIKRSPLKNASLSSFSFKSAMSSFSNGAKSPGATISAKQLWAARRKSTSHINVTPSCIRYTSKSFSITKLASTTKKSASISPKKTVPTTQASTQSQIVLRVRGRTGDGRPELVISKKPVRFIAWHWNDRCIRVPFMNVANFIDLGPAQHSIMLRQLRYVKSMMHDLPWAKSHLRSLLSKYTAKDVSKEQLYPQLNSLGYQVQQEVADRAKQNRALVARKKYLTITLTVAAGVVNDTIITKFGRRGRPHASRLLYDPTNPLQLRWRRKHGEISAEYLAVDEIQIVEAPEANHNDRLNGGAGTFGRGNKKAAAAVAVDPNTCFSLVTPMRSLDLQVASALHREWLANAVRDIVSFAKQFKAARANTVTTEISNIRDSVTLVRRPRQIISVPVPNTRNALPY